MIVNSEILINTILNFIKDNQKDLQIISKKMQEDGFLIGACRKILVHHDFSLFKDSIIGLYGLTKIFYDVSKDNIFSVNKWFTEDEIDYFENLIKRD